MPALAGMLLLQWGAWLNLPTWKLWSWGGATLVVVAIRYLSPSGEPDGRNTSNIYIGLGSMAGALLGLLAGINYILAGTIIGAVMGAMAYSRTPHGRWIKMGRNTLIQYFCAKCLPTIVAVAMIGTCAEGLLFYLETFYHYQ